MKAEESFGPKTASPDCNRCDRDIIASLTQAADNRRLEALLLVLWFQCHPCIDRRTAADALDPKPNFRADFDGLTFTNLALIDT